MYGWNSWLAKGGSPCASTNLEAPYLGPAVFGVQDDEIPSVTLPPGRALVDARMCSDEQVTAVNYILDGSVWVLLVSGPKEWAIGPGERRLEELQEVSVNGRAGALLPATEVTPGQFGPTGATLIVDAPFGLLVVYGSTLFNEEALQIASDIDLDAVTIPEGDPTFVGDLNGVSFYDYRDAGECRYGPMGSGATQTREAPLDERLLIEPGYVPNGAKLTGTELAHVCPQFESFEAFYQLPDQSQYWIVRKSGVPEWFSVYSREWYKESTIAGRPAVIVESPGVSTDAGAQVYVVEDFGLTTVYGPDREEAIRIAEGLNR
jgi:hypothetical protein